MKHIFASVVAAVAMASAAPSYAASYILTQDDDLNSNFLLEVSTPTFVNATLKNLLPANSGFTDYYYFAPTFMGVGAGSAITDAFTGILFGNPGLRVEAFDFANGDDAFIALFTGFTTDSQAAYDAAVLTLDTVTGTATHPFQYGVNGTPGADPLDRQLAGVPLDPSFYYRIQIDGTSGDNPATYTGTLTATSVPEPTTWAMMLAGFGAIGFAMRRGRQSHPKVRFAF